MSRAARHALRVVGGGVLLGIALYAGYLLLAMLR